MSPAAGAGAIYRRRAELLRELAALELELAAFAAAEPEPPDEVLDLAQAAAFVNEPAATVRRKAEYLKARVSRPGARRLRYSREALCAIVKAQRGAVRP